MELREPNSNYLKDLAKKGVDYDLSLLSGGYVNKVYLLLVHKKKIEHYVLKFYKTEKEIKKTIDNYKLVYKQIRTPEIIFSDIENKELVEEHIAGKSFRKLIEEKNKDLRKHLRKLTLLLKELHKIHLKKTKWYTIRKDSLDEKKLLKHSRILYKKGRIEEEEYRLIKKRVKKYVPKWISLIHGDSHLGNFMMSNKGKIYMIDLDEMKFSDPHADLGKFINEIDEICYTAGYTRKKINSFIKMILELYRGVNIKGLDLFRLRTPLIELKLKKNAAYDVVRYLIEHKSK
jgi:thiamine kinase-like enzyme